MLADHKDPFPPATDSIQLWPSSLELDRVWISFQPQVGTYSSLIQASLFLPVRRLHCATPFPWPRGITVYNPMGTRLLRWEAPQWPSSSQFTRLMANDHQSSLVIRRLSAIHLLWCIPKRTAWLSTRKIDALLRRYLPTSPKKRYGLGLTASGAGRWIKLGFSLELNND